MFPWVLSRPSRTSSANAPAPEDPAVEPALGSDPRRDRGVSPGGDHGLDAPCGLAEPVPRWPAPLALRLGRARVPRARGAVAGWLARDPPAWRRLWNH